ncbi:MAG: hypothetical protein M1522_00015 [Actinobacteria bacterium]|nr:hypothetical protein [Actinomycetota bacterium]
MFQAEFDVRARLSADELDNLTEVVELIRAGLSEKELARHLHRLFREDPNFIYLVMQLVGLTRSKILTDLRAALAGGGGKAPSAAHLLPERPQAWALAGPYLAKRLRMAFTPLLACHGEALHGALEGMNQATWPGWIRQERAKRQGHAAEGRLAVLLQSLGIPFEPREKAENPLCADATFRGVSFDIIVPDVEEPGLCVKATVHTANIGQYGESKDHLEVSEAVEVLSAADDPPVLLALIDGVGFFSNTAGLEGVLTKADEFCQLATLWKAGVLAAHASGLLVALVLPDASEHAAFLCRYANSIELVDKPDDDPGWVEAGEALVRVVG